MILQGKKSPCSMLELEKWCPQPNIGEPIHEYESKHNMMWHETNEFNFPIPRYSYDIPPKTICNIPTMTAHADRYGGPCVTHKAATTPEHSTTPLLLNYKYKFQLGCGKQQATATNQRKFNLRGFCIPLIQRHGFGP